MILKNSNAEDFIKNLKGRKVICFGAGSTLMEVGYEVRTIEGLENHIDFFIDNDKNKCGLKFTYCNKEFDIKSADELLHINVSNYVLLITCAAYCEIYLQLRDIPELHDIDCYMYNVVCSYPSLDVANFFVNEIEKKPYKNWKQILSNLHLKDKHKGQRCFIIGNGPSLTIEDLGLLKGEITFAANRIFKIFNDTDWRPTYYICLDYLMYGLDHEEINSIDSEIRFVPLGRALAAGKVYDEITYYDRKETYAIAKKGKVIKTKSFEFTENVENVIYGGQTVLYDAMQFAVYMGFSEIYILGADNSYKLELQENGEIVEHNTVKNNHFNENYDDGLEDAIAVVSQPFLTNEALKKAREICEEKGIIIKNATRGGRLEIFDRISLEEALGNK